MKFDFIRNKAPGVNPTNLGNNTEQVDWSVSASVLYLGGSLFEYWPGHRLFWPSFLVVSLSER
jgi:hypothetical protein